jgi:hypothetical protein
MSNTNTGGTAFPFPGYTYPNGEIIYGEFGMTLRDYFAAKAMAADMTDGIHENDFAWAAARAYKVADALLKAREA